MGITDYGFEPQIGRFVFTYDISMLDAPSEEPEPDDYLHMCRLFGGLFGGPVRDVEFRMNFADVQMSASLDR